MPNVYEGDTQRFLKLKPLYIDPAPEGDNNKGFVSDAGLGAAGLVR